MSGKPNPLKHQIITMFMSGMTGVEISDAIGQSTDRVYRAINGVRRPPRPMNGNQALKSAQYTLGRASNIPTDAMSVVRREIGPRETIIDCMSRLIVQHETIRREIILSCASRLIEWDQ